MIERQEVYLEKFNPAPVLPYELSTLNFQHAMKDVYDFFYDMNLNLRAKGLRRFEDMSRAAMLSGMLSDMLTDSIAQHSRTLVVNQHHNGHPDLLENGRYANDNVLSGEHGVEVKTTNKKGGAVDTHGARTQWMCVFVYEIDKLTEPADDRRPLKFNEIYLGKVEADDFRSNARGELGTRTATLDADGIAKLRQNWIYKDLPEPRSRAVRSLSAVPTLE